jgi:fatty acid desaturase
VEFHEPESSAGDDGERAAEPRHDSTRDRVPEPEGRRYPSTIGGAFYLLVLVAAGAGLAIVAGGNWRLGVKWIGGSLVFAAVVRLFLPAHDAGMLAVRRRFVDVVLLAGVGVLLWFLSTSIPNQPPL